MSGLVTTPNLPDTDGFYAALLKAHEGLSDAESVALNTRLVLILANHVGDAKVLEAALKLAREAGTPGEQAAPADG
jgi:hypothetical protein